MKNERKARIMSGTLTEFEESLSFDVDDPDFVSPNSQTLTNTRTNDKPGIFQVDYIPNINIMSTLSNQSGKMSVTSVETTSETLSREGSSNSLTRMSRSDSFEALNGSHPQYQDTVVTIEELRAQLNSCFTCGVSWIQEHVTLDCRECGGYSLQRPCPVCEGRCHVLWKRNLTSSHASREARWTGQCGLSCAPTHEESLVPALEKLRATS